MIAATYWIQGLCGVVGLAALALAATAFHAGRHDIAAVNVVLFFVNVALFLVQFALRARLSS